MKYRIDNLLAAKSILTAGTETIDINTRDLISRITVKVALTNASWTPTGHPARAIVKVELVDGADVIHSMRGSYSEALAWYGTKEQPFNYENYTDNGIAVATVPIYFGRFLYDPMFAFDPSKFRNPQLKITHNYALGGAAPDAATLEVWADLFDENPPSPIAFLSGKSLWAQTLVATTNYYIELPTDHPIRLVLPAAFSNVEEPDINIDNFKIDEGAGKRILFEMSTLNALQMFENRYPEFQSWFEGRTLANNDITFYQAIQKDVIYALSSSQDSDGYINQIWSGGGIRKVNENATVTIMGKTIGRCPFGVFPIPMGLLNEPDSWWDVTKVGSPRIKLVTGAGSTAAELELLIQQVRHY
jgi:hypothetical protein